MKRLILIVSLILMAISSYAINQTNKTIKIDLEKEGLFTGLQIYYVKAGTETAASIEISGRNPAASGDTVTLSTITLVVTGGLRPGTTWWAISDSAINANLSTFESWIEQHDSSATGTNFVQAAQPAYLNCFQGEWVIVPSSVTRIASQSIESLADRTPTDVFSSTQAKTMLLYASSVTCFSYTMPATRGQNIAIEAIISTITHTGTAYEAIYDNSSTPQLITPAFFLPATTAGLYTLPPTAIPGPIAVNYAPTIRVFTEKSDMTEYLTKGWLYVIYKVD